MATQPRRLRADDLLDIIVDDPLVSGYELVDGELIPVSPANPQHGALIVRIASLLDAYVGPRRLGRVLSDPWVRLGLPHDLERVRAPDVAYISREKLESGGQIPGDFLRAVPDIAVEVLSPTNQRKPRDFHQRIRDYVDAGVPLLWVFHPGARYATVYRADGSARILRDNESLEGESVLPGFVLPLADVFEVLEPFDSL